MTRRGVLLLNTGTPDQPTPDAVRRYLDEFLRDPRICPMNPVMWGAILRFCILPKRSVASAEKYQRIWTEKGSPLLVNALSLASRLEAQLQAGGQDVVVRAAMSYGSPSVKKSLVRMRELGCESIAVIPLYPQSAFSTTKSALDKVDSALEEMGWDVSRFDVCDYHDEPLYIEAISRAVKRAGFGTSDRDRLVFAFHSIPICDIDAGDTYEDEALRSVELIADSLELDESQFSYGFQCRFDRSRRWLGPPVVDAIDKALLDGSRIFVVAPNFSIDCLETLYDIDTVLREKIASHRSCDKDDALVYVRCLNDSQDQVDLLEALVRRSCDR